MLTFRSASLRQVDSVKAMASCIEAAGGPQDCRLLIFNACMGHDFGQLAAEAQRLCPRARVLGASCCGIVGREGVSETLKDLAVMLIGGEEWAVVSMDGFNSHTAHAKGLAMARDLQSQLPQVRCIQLLGPGIDTANDLLLRAFEEVFGPEVTVFGATASDNMRGITSLQSDGSQVMRHGVWAVGYADSSLEVETQASHGFVAMGEPLVVTRCEGTRILEFNGRPSWGEYTQRLGLDPQRATCAESIPIGALAEPLQPEVALEYGNPHLLRVITKRDDDGAIHYPCQVREGLRLWLTVRDESRIFADLERMMQQMVSRIGSGTVLAVFHSDCLARGRFMLQRVDKEELVAKMQRPLQRGGLTPPWLGMYGFGEFARLGNRNTFHNYSTALACLFRRA